MIREIYKDHPYRTGRSHLDFVRHRGLPTAVDIVLRRLIAHADQLQHRQALNQHPTETVLTVGHTMHPCPDCQAAFSTRTPHDHTHKVFLQHPVCFNQARDALLGLPTYSHCNHVFHDWHHLIHHIESRACLVF